MKFFIRSTVNESNNSDGYWNGYKIQKLINPKKKKKKTRHAGNNFDGFYQKLQKIIIDHFFYIFTTFAGTVVLFSFLF